MEQLVMVRIGRLHSILFLCDNHCISHHQICTCMSLYFTVYIRVIYFNIDIDECANNTDNCIQTCTNTEGSFTCGCNDGYILDSDGTTCNGTY